MSRAITQVDNLIIRDSTVQEKEELAIIAREYVMSLEEAPRQSLFCLDG